MTAAAGVGERIRRLRTALGISQAELAERVGLPTGALSMLENGRLQFDEVVIESLATVLDCSTGYLTDARTEPLSSKPLLRAYADAPSRFVDRTIADTVTAIEFAGQLDLTMMPDLLPVFGGDLNDEHEIEAFADEVRLQAGIEAGDVVGNMIRAAERLGCVVLPMESELGRHLGLSMRVNDVAVIRVARPSPGEGSISGDRQRFTVAHELGHLVLHYASAPPNSAVEASRVEKQAHRFAAAFLTPGDAILADLERHGGRVTLGTLAQLKEIWGVAIKALVVRFQQLHVVDDEQARSLYKQISARKWNRHEPVPVGHEAAIWMSRAIEKKVASETEVVEEAARRAGIGASYARRWTTWLAVQAEPVGEIVNFEARRGASATHERAASEVIRLPIRRIRN